MDIKMEIIVRVDDETAAALLEEYREDDVETLEGAVEMAFFSSDASRPYLITNGGLEVDMAVFGADPLP